MRADVQPQTDANGSVKQDMAAQRAKFNDERSVDRRCDQHDPEACGAATILLHRAASRSGREDGTARSLLDAVVLGLRLSLHPEQLAVREEGSKRHLRAEPQSEYTLANSAKL